MSRLCCCECESITDEMPVHLSLTFSLPQVSSQKYQIAAAVLPFPTDLGPNRQGNHLFNSVCMFPQQLFVPEHLRSTANSTLSHRYNLCTCKREQLSHLSNITKLSRFHIFQKNQSLKSCVYCMTVCRVAENAKVRER